jgi:hypothetical protein
MTLEFPLPSADASILRWSDHDMSVWDKLSVDAQAMSRRIDNPGLSAETSQRARTVLASEHPELHPDLADRKICRAIVTLWAGDRRLAEETMRVPVLQMVCDNGNFTRLFTFALANVYFTHFVHLDEWDEGLFAVDIRPSAGGRCATDCLAWPGCTLRCSGASRARHRGGCSRTDCSASL